MIVKPFKTSLRHQLTAATLSVFFANVLFCPSMDAKGIFSGDDKETQSQGQLQSQLYQISQQLTQVQAQMTQLQLQLNKRIGVMEQKQLALQETINHQNTLLTGMAHHGVPQTQHVEPVAARVAPVQAPATQPSLEEAADNEVAVTNTKSTPSYKSHIHDVSAQDAAIKADAALKTEAAQKAEAAKKVLALKKEQQLKEQQLKDQQVREAKAAAADAAAIAAATANTPATTTKLSKKEKQEKEKQEKERLAEEKSSHMLPGVVGERLAKVKTSKNDDKTKEDKTTLQAAAPSKITNSGKPRLRASIVIKAPPEVVWEAVHEERKTDPDMAYSKVLRQGVNEATLEQKFTLIPVIGSAVCVMNTQEVPNRRIDYQLVKSDRFKAMEGSWVLTPSADGKSTTLELSSHLDLGLPIPKSMFNSVAEKKLQKRVAHVRELAEKSLVAQKRGTGIQ